MNLETLENLRVICIDDSRASLSFFSGLLSSLKCQVSTFLNPLDAINSLKSQSENLPELIITDYEMPNLNGLSLIQELKKHAHLSDIPTLLITTKNKSALLVSAVEAGADAFITKEDAQEVLPAHMLALIRAKRKSQALGEATAASKYDRLQIILDNMTEGLLLHDSNGIIIESNERAPEIFGLKRDQLIGKDPQKAGVRIIKEDLTDLPPAEQPAIQALSTGKQQKNTLIGIYLPTNELRWIRINATPIFNPNALPSNATPDQVLVTFSDVTELKQAEASLISSAKLSSLGEMAGGIAHEINNPLAIIQGKVEVIKNRIKDPNFDRAKIDQDLYKIGLTTQRIAKIISGLRSFSRNSDADPMEVCDFAQSVEDTLELCKERFKNHGIELRYQLCDPALKIECRSSQIAQIIINLLGNAHDAVEQLAEKWISLDIQDCGDQIEVLVTDSGNGIRPEVAAKLMQPFFTTKTVGKGTGLGLSISKGIAEEHQGSIEYDASHPNTRFVLRLPKTQPKYRSIKTA